MKDADRDASLARLEARWSSVDHVRTWIGLPRELRARVTAELEETARQLDGSSPEAAAFVAALDALDALPDAAELLGLHVASDDVRALIELAKNARTSS